MVSRTFRTGPPPERRTSKMPGPNSPPLPSTPWQPAQRAANCFAPDAVSCAVVGSAHKSAAHRTSQYCGTGKFCLALGGAAASHDWPNIDNSIGLGDIVSIVIVRTVIKDGAENFHPIPQLEILVAIFPLQEPVLGALRGHLKPRHSFHLVGWSDTSLIAVVDRGLVGAAFAIDRGKHGQGSAEI